MFILDESILSRVIGVLKLWVFIVATVLDQLWNRITTSGFWMRQWFVQAFFVLLYLAAIIVANLMTARFGPAATIINALLFIGLDLVARDRLHEAWHGRGLVWKMGVLIATGSLLSWLLNRNAGQIAVASFVAFALAAVTDTLTYSIGLRQGWTWFVRCNGSNLTSAAVDSLAFPTLAFGGFMPWVTFGQLAAKVCGGMLWSLILRKQTLKHANVQTCKRVNGEYHAVN